MHEAAARWNPGLSRLQFVLGVVALSLAAACSPAADDGGPPESIEETARAVMSAWLSDDYPAVENMVSGGLASRPEAWGTVRGAGSELPQIIGQTCGPDELSGGADLACSFELDGVDGTFDLIGIPSDDDGHRITTAIDRTG